MALLRERRPKPARARRNSIVAAAERIDPRDRRRLDQIARNRQQWQDAAWGYYDTLGEIHFAHMWVQNMCSRVRIFPAWRPDSFSGPVPLDPDDPDQRALGLEPVARAARVELDRLGGIDATHGPLIGALAANVALVGEAWLVGQPDPDIPAGERWDAFSSRELRVVDGQFQIFDDDAATSGRPLPADAFVMRVWRRHPKYRQRADAPMRALLDDCEELLLLKRAVRASGQSRLNAGILFVDESLTLPGRVGEASDQGEDDPFLQDLMTAMMTPISDPDSATALVPLIVKGQRTKDIGSLIEHIKIERPVTEVEMRQRAELREALAIGLDLPREILLGLAQANHWTAWQIDEQSFKAHLEPLVLVVTSAISTWFLAPALFAKGLDPSGVVVGHDPSDLIGDTDEFDRAQAMHDRLVVSDAYLRRKGGASDEDAPDDDELERRERRRRVRQPSLFDDDPAGQGPPGDRPAAGERGAPAEPAGDDRPLAASAATALRASGSLDRLGVRLAEMDRSLRRRITEWSDAAVRRAIEMAGARVRRHTNGNPQLRALRGEIAGLDTIDVVAYLGPGRLAQLGLTEEELLDDELADLEARYRAATSRTAREALRAAIREVRAELDDEFLAGYDAQTDENIDAGWLLLAAALRGVARERLYDPRPTVDGPGEFDALSLVPAGVVRESLARAGGATRPIGDAAVGLLERPVGGVAAGELVLHTLADEFGIDTTLYRWSYGDPAARARPFEPHEVLDGLEFAAWDDPLLTNPETFPATPYFFPGDHVGCLCDAIPIFKARLRGEV